METFEKRAKFVKDLVAKTGKTPDTFDAGTSSEELRKNILLDMSEAVRQVDALRAGSKDHRAIDLSIGDFAKEKWGFAPSDSGSPDSFYDALNINPSNATIQSLMTMPDFGESYRWLIVEVIREAVRLGLRRAPLYPNLIAAEENVLQPSVIMPSINMSDSMPTKIGETETIPTGTVSFGEKSVKLQKLATGLKITDEVKQYVSINVLSLYLEDVGVKMNLGLDNMLIDVLINGDGNSNAAPVIGVQTLNSFTYYDLLRAWIRMGMLGRLPQSMLSNENPALEILQLPEFKGYGTNIGSILAASQPALARINLRTPVPTNQSYDVHGAMPLNNQVMLIDNRSAAIKLNSAALRVESQRIVERQLDGTYVSMTTGFAKLFDDAAVLIDKSVAFSSQGFPTWMDPQAVMKQAFKTAF